jgi:AcrR family transcriptional regulator
MNWFIYEVIHFCDARMDGRRQRQKRSRQQRILSAARVLFAAKGYAETAMHEIAASADLAVGTLYNYFSCKPDLLVAIVRRETEEALAAGGRILEHPSPDPLEAVTELIDAYVQPLAAHDRKLWREVVCAAFSEPNTIGARVFESDLRLIAQLASFFESLRERGVPVADVDCGRLSIALYAIYFTWFNAYLMSEGMTLDDLRREIRYGIRALLRGMLACAEQTMIRPAEESP